MSSLVLMGGLLGSNFISQYHGFGQKICILSYACMFVDSPLFQLERRLSQLLTLALTLLILLSVLAAAAVVKVTNLIAVKDWLLQPLVHLIMRETQPPGGGVAAASLGRELGEELPEVPRAVAAGVQPAEEVDEGLEGGAVVLGRRLGEARGHGVEELPRCAAQLSSVKQKKISKREIIIKLAWTALCSTK